MKNKNYGINDESSESEKKKWKEKTKKEKKRLQKIIIYTSLNVNA